MAENRSEEMSQDMPESGSADPNQSALAPGHTTDIASHPALANQTGLQHLDTRHVRLRTGDQFTESVSDYIGMFQELQIDPVYHGAFWSDVIYRYRQSTRHLPLLKRGTAVSIKTMSDDILRGYGVRIWGPNSEWRRVLAAGEDMLLYDKDGDNTSLHEILTRLWWKMRELVFEEKPASTRRQQRTSRRAPAQRNSIDEAQSEDDEIYQADIDDNTPVGTDTEAPLTMAPNRMTPAQAQATRMLNNAAQQLPSPAPGRYLTFQQTEEEVMAIVERVHNLRISSNPNIFERLWAAHIGRVEEIEQDLEPFEMTPMGHLVDEEGNDLINKDDEAVASGSNPVDTNFAATGRGEGSMTISTDAAAPPFLAGLLSDEQRRRLVYPNHSAEPFNTTGNPIPPTMTEMHNLPPTLPKIMSVYIMTSPTYVPYVNRAYHHPAAPVQEQNQVAFYTQIMQRAERIADKDVKGYTFSYGWCDISRWVEKTVGFGCGGRGNGEAAGESEGEKRGWHVFQRDLVDAAKAGVMVWRMKVLVVEK